MKNRELWTKIKLFKLDVDQAHFSFSQRLARDNNWTHEFALKVVEEYRRFIYLCCISEGQMITPSDAVDQAWHLHLTYTKSYWNDFCKYTLEQEIHHNPTKGGHKEREKFTNCYDLTFELYRQEFGEEPKEHIWWNSQKRFKEVDFKRCQQPCLLDHSQTELSS